MSTALIQAPFYENGCVVTGRAKYNFTRSGDSIRVVLAYSVFDGKPIVIEDKCDPFRAHVAAKQFVVSWEASTTPCTKYVDDNPDTITRLVKQRNESTMISAFESMEGGIPTFVIITILPKNGVTC